MRRTLNTWRHNRRAQETQAWNNWYQGVTPRKIVRPRSVLAGVLVVCLVSWWDATTRWNNTNRER